MIGGIHGDEERHTAFRGEASISVGDGIATGAGLAMVQGFETGLEMGSAINLVVAAGGGIRQAGEPASQSLADVGGSDVLIVFRIHRSRREKDHMPMQVGSRACSIGISRLHVSWMATRINQANHPIRLPSPTLVAIPCLWIASQSGEAPLAAADRIGRRKFQ